jgi:hypothetical protein
LVGAPVTPVSVLAETVTFITVASGPEEAHGWRDGSDGVA